MGVSEVAMLMASILWIIYRVFLVFQKPVEELEEVLGIDIPPVPDVTLSNITGDSVLLYWKPPENYHAPLKHRIQVNGITVGEFDRSDATVQITGLQPGNYYGIRAVATNSTGNSSYSSLIQVQTVPCGGHRGQKLLANVEQSSSTLTKRSTTGRRTSQPTPNPSHDATRAVSGDPAGIDDNEMIARLTRKLDSLRRQKEEVESQLAEEADEAENSKACLIKERDDSKHMVEEKEKASLEFKRQVNELEKQCKAAQRKKSAKERILQQKKAERQKMKDDIVRWETERAEMEEDAENLREEKANFEGNHEERMTGAQSLIDAAQTDSVRMEEELRELGTQVKVLEEARARADRQQNVEEEEAERREMEEEQLHDRNILELQNQYATLWKLAAQSEAQVQVAQDRLAFLLDLKIRDPTLFVPIAGLDYPVTSMFPSSRRQRLSGPRVNTLSLQTAPYSNHATFNSTSSASPTFPSVFPFFGAPGQAIGDSLGMTQHEREHLTAGAPMSPSADILLPANLLGDDDDSRPVFNRIRTGRGSIGSITQGWRPPSTDKHIQEPQSPQSVDSKSPSLFSSPHESLSNIQNFYGRDPRAEDEAQSINSTESPFAMPLRATSNGGSSRKISGLFNFNRQRDKGPLAELPALGTLKQGQSQSFPLNLDQDPALLASTGRRKGVGIWSNPIPSFLTRGTGAQPGDDNLAVVGPRKTRRGMFGSKLEPSEVLGNPASRPSSTYSFEHGLLQPSADIHRFGWSMPDPARPRGATLNAERSPAAGPWAHGQARRQSIPHGSTSNLSIGSTPLDPADDFSSPFAFGGAKAHQPAPIGTERFRVSQRPNTPKLNPAAPSFTTRFFTRNESKKTPKSEKSVDLGSDKGAKSSRDGSDKNTKDSSDTHSKTSSPSMSRLSQDAHSIATSASIGESYESLEPSISAASQPDSAAASGSTPGSSAPKETLMQRITRKSSSSKFSVPWSKTSSSNKEPSVSSAVSIKDQQPSTPGEIDEEGEERAGGDYLTAGNAASATSTPQQEGGKSSGTSALSWSRVMGKGKRRGAGANSASNAGTPKGPSSEAGESLSTSALSDVEGVSGEE